MRRSFGFAICAGLLALSGCGPAKTYRFPTGDHPPQPGRATPEDEALFRQNYHVFAAEFSDWANQNTEAELVPVLSAYQTGLILLSAAESRGYQNAAHFQRTLEPDDYALTAGFSMIKSADKQLARSSLWLVLPVKVEDRFIEDSARNLNADIMRLGNAGLTAERAVETWLNRFNPQLNVTPPALELTRPIIALGGTAMDFQPKSVEFQIIESGWRISDSEDRTLLIWRASESMPKFDQKAAGSHPIGEVKTWQSALNLKPYAEAVGADGLFREENDFRNLSVEFRGDGVISEITQYAALRAPLPKNLAPGNYHLAVISSEGLPYLLGRFSIERF